MSAILLTSHELKQKQEACVMHPGYVPLTHHFVRETQESRKNTHERSTKKPKYKSHR